MDLYIKTIIIHQFRPDDTELVLAEQPLLLTPKIDAYFQKKLTKVFSDDAKRGQFDDDHDFMTILTDDFLESSVKFSELWKEEFVVSDNQKVNDLVFIQFDKDGNNYFAFLRLTLREQFIHNNELTDSPLKISQNNLPSAAQTPDEALVINLKTRHYYLIEKRIKHNGSFSNYFSENLLQVKPEASVTKSLKLMEQTAQKVADNFNRDDFNFQSKLKSSIYQQLEQEEELSPEKLADQLFDDNLTARLTFVDELKDSLPDKIKLTDIDASRQLKKRDSQKLSLSNGIELIVPHHIYQDADMVEFIPNDDGTYSILIKNIQDIQSK